MVGGSRGVRAAWLPRPFSKKARPVGLAWLRAPLGTPQYEWKRQLAVLERLLAKLPDVAVPMLRRREERVPGRNAKQVRGERAEEVVAAYLAGASVYEVAERFGNVRQTVSNVLKRHGVKLRRGGLSPEQVDEAARLYGEGWSLARIARRMEVSPDTVRLRLLERRMRMRDRHGEVGRET